MKALPIPPKEASRYLKYKFNLRFSHNTLAKLRCHGDGPEFLKFRGSIYYEPEELDRWVNWRTSKHSSSSQYPRSPKDRDVDIFEQFGLKSPSGKRNDNNDGGGGMSAPN